MIELVSCQVAGALQGGLWMLARSSSPQEQAPLAQVWPALSVDLRTRVSGLLAQLAMNIVMARPGDEAVGKEVACACPQADPQNPS